MDFQFAAKTEKGRKRNAEEPNGDHCVVGRLFGKGSETQALLVLSDGLDEELPHQIMNFFGNLSSSLTKNFISLDTAILPTALRKMTAAIVKDVAVSGFITVCWNSNENAASVCSLGNVRIYKHTLADGLLLVNTDCHAEGTNLAVGLLDFLPGDSIVVCSDGMYNSSSFREDVEKLLREVDLRASIDNVGTTDDDDMSIAVLRRNLLNADNINFQDLLDRFLDYRARLSQDVFAEKLCNELESLLGGDLDIEQFGKMASLMKCYHVRPEKVQIDSVFTKAVERLNAMPEGEEKQRFNTICYELKDILKIVFSS